MRNLPSLRKQTDRLIDLGVPGLLGQSASQIRSAAEELSKRHGQTEALLVPTAVPPAYAQLMELVVHQGKPGFVVADFADVADFSAVSGPQSKPAELPGADWYALVDPRRGDEFENASPSEALVAISDNARIPLTVAEGIFWLYQQPEMLERNHCFMTIGSRKPKARSGFDSRTPALWISNGTGRDGGANRGAPKLGWCWWNNRHTWLGIAHAALRVW